MAAGQVQGGTSLSHAGRAGVDCRQAAQAEAAVELVEEAASGHIRVGLEDFAFTGKVQPTNAELVARAAAVVRAMGCEVANVEDAREMLGVV